MSVGVKNYNYGLVRKEPSFKRTCCMLMTTKEDAQNVLNLMRSLLDKEGFVSVYDLYLAIGAKTSTEDDLIGWCSLSGALIKPTFDRKEFRLILPKLNSDIRDSQ